MGARPHANTRHFFYVLLYSLFASSKAKECGNGADESALTPATGYAT